MSDKRGKCCVCGRRTRHVVENKWFCAICEEMALEDKLTPEDTKKLNMVSKFSQGELRQILKATKPSKVNSKTYNHSTTGHVRVGILSDTHIGAKEFDEGLFKYAGEVFRKEKVQGVYHAGDILEGMSGRDGHIYELAQVGFNDQIKYAEELFRKYFKGLQVYGITGNHDHWYKAKNNAGVSVGEELEHRVENYTFLGESEADVKLGKGCIMKLFHPADGTAYATSYKIQKLIESIEGGHKPNIIVEGHYHKALYMFNRNVHAVEAGTLCGQTSWMRGKKIPAHKGFWVLDIDMDKKGIKKFTPTFYPAYD